MRALILGCGYAGLALGKALIQQGDSVWGARRSEEGREEIARAGIHFVRADISRREELETLPAGMDWVVNLVSSSRGGIDDYQRAYVQGTKNLLEKFRDSPPRKFVYASSTSVYNRHDGAVVTEESEASPANDLSQVLLEAEQLLRDAWQAWGFPAVILRAAGIYGPGRGYWLNQFLSGHARLRDEGRRHMNMIHRDDLAGVIAAALRRGAPGAIYNAVDNEPVRQRDFFAWLAERTGLPMPAAGDFERGKRAASDKQVSNAKLRRELGYDFKYPTFREGCAAELDARR